MMAARSPNSVALRAAIAVAMVLLSACPPVTPEDEIPEGAFALDATTLVTDATAIGSSWYDYDFEFHTVKPAARASIVRTGDVGNERFAAFRVLSYYDEDTAESGAFTLAVSTFDGAWSSETTWKAPHNVRKDGPLCVDLFAPDEVACDGDQWQISLRVVPLFIPEAGIVVGNPSITARSIAGLPRAGDVHVATVSLDTTLENLPAPSTIANLDDTPSGLWAFPSWDRTKFAPHLPHQGMVIGERLLDGQSDAAGDVFFIMTPRQTLHRASLARATDDPEGALTVRTATAPLDADIALFLPFGDVKEITVALPPTGLMGFYRFDADELIAFDPAVDTPFVDATMSLSPPNERDWDFALQNVDDKIRFLLSPACALQNHTANGGVNATKLDDALPGSAP